MERADPAGRSAALEAKVEASRLDVVRLQQQLGEDPASLFSYVAREIRHEPYVGFLRGPEGTLMGGAGNAMDRASLLSALLRAAGYEVRFASGRLPPEQAEPLIRHAFDVPPRPLGEAPAEDRAFLEGIVERAWDHFLLLEEALYEGGVQVGEDLAAGWRGALEATSRHVWVQYRDGDDWIDADPVPGLELGDALIPAERTMSEPDASDLHRLQFTIRIVDSVSGRSEVVLAHETVALEVAREAVGLFFEREGTRAVPVLLVGARTIRGDAFELEAQGEEPGRSAGGPAGLFGDAMGGLGGRRPEEPTPPAARPVEVFLHVESLTPYRERQGTLRLMPRPGTLEDADGEGPLGGIEGVWGIAISVGSAAAELPVALLSGVADPRSKEGVSRLLGVLGAQYRMLRDLTPPSFLETDPLLFQDGPNVVVAGFHPTGGDSFDLSLDLTLKSYRWLRPPEDPLAEYGPFYDGLVNGVLDHTVERALLAAVGDDRSLGALLEVTLAEDLPFLVTAHGRQPSRTELGDAGRERLWSALDAGHAVVLPRVRSPSWAGWEMAWWQVDPTTGWTEDVTESGHGQAVAGRAAMERRRPADVAASQRLACALRVAMEVSVSVMVAVSPYIGQEAEVAAEVADGLSDALGDMSRCRTPAVRRPSRRADPFSKPFPRKQPRIERVGPPSRGPWHLPRDRLRPRGR